MVAPDHPLTCAEKLAAAHESATLLQASWKLADIVDGALEGAVASTLEDASRHPVAEAAAAELLGASAARHGVEARPWLLRPPHATSHERNAVLRACDRNVKRALAAKLGTDEKYGEARAALLRRFRTFDGMDKSQDAAMQLQFDLLFVGGALRPVAACVPGTRDSALESTRGEPRAARAGGPRPRRRPSRPPRRP